MIYSLAVRSVRKIRFLCGIVSATYWLSSSKVFFRVQFAADRHDESREVYIVPPILGCDGARVKGVFYYDEELI